MINDDWDSVSNSAPPQQYKGADDPWDAVSTPQPSRKRRIIPDNLTLDDLITPEEDLQEEEQPHVLPSSAPPHKNFNVPSTRQDFISASFLKNVALVGGVVLLLLASSFGVFQGISIHNANVAATVMAQTESTAFVTHVYGTATAQAISTATTQQQIYNQATSGNPALDDPLSDNRNSWGIFTTSWGGICAFTGGAYYLALAYPHYIIWCTSAAVAHLNNFALKVQINIVKGDNGGVAFGDSANASYRMFINSNGTYFLVQFMKGNNQAQTLLNSSSSAIKAGLNQNNVMTIIVNNSKFYLYINGQFVTTDSLNFYSTGAAGFTGQSDNQSTEVMYNNLKVWTL